MNFVKSNFGFAQCLNNITLLKIFSNHIIDFRSMFWLFVPFIPTKPIFTIFARFALLFLAIIVHPAFSQALPYPAVDAVPFFSSSFPDAGKYDQKPEQLINRIIIIYL